MWNATVFISAGSGMWNATEVGVMRCTEYIYYSSEITIRKETLSEAVHALVQVCCYDDPCSTPLSKGWLYGKSTILIKLKTI